jgi:hypothetical protein
MKSGSHQKPPSLTTTRKLGNLSNRPCMIMLPTNAMLMAEAEIPTSSVQVRVPSDSGVAFCQNVPICEVMTRSCSSAASKIGSCLAVPIGS